MLVASSGSIWRGSYVRRGGQPQPVIGKGIKIWAVKYEVRLLSGYQSTGGQARPKDLTVKLRRKRQPKRNGAADRRVKLGRHPLGSFAGGQQGTDLVPPMQIKILITVGSLSAENGQSGVS